MSYLCHVLIYIDIYVILALSLNLVLGYSRLFTLAHASYFSVGAYTYALASVRLGWGFVRAGLAAVLVAAALSFLISLPAWRFTGDFFVLISIAVQTVLFSVFYNWRTPDAPIGSWQNLTNGSFGIAGIPHPAIPGIRFDTICSMAVFASFMTSVLAVIYLILLDSPWGRLLEIIRDDELAARGLGKNVRLTRVQIFCIACGSAGLAGAIYASYVSYVDPSSASLEHSILILSMVIVGGAGNFRGPVLGAVVLVLIPELLRFAGLPDQLAANLELMAYGVLLVAFMHFRPQGIAGEYRIE